MAPTLHVGPNLRVLATAIGVCALAVLAVRGLESHGASVQRLEVAGELERIDIAALRRRVEPLLSGPFMALPIAAIQAEVEAEPWVAAARVERDWPDGVSIRIWSHRAIARWGDERLLSAEGVLFAAEAPGEELPRLSGPDARTDTLVATWRELSTALSATRFRLAGLRLDQRGSWTAQCADGTELRLGRGDPARHLASLRGPVIEALGKGGGRARYIDMRYDNGFAIGWAEDAIRGEENSNG